jgi:type IV secretion system protein VirB5
VKVATASKVQPFIVEVDKLGEAAAIKRAEPVDFKDSRFEKMIRAEIIRFIENIRSVTTDKAVQKVWVKHAYALVNAPVSEYLNNYFKDPIHDPFSISKVNTVSIEIESVIPSSPETWEVVWTEIKQPSGANGGATLEKTRWKAIVGIAKYEQKSESQIIINPAGFVITSLSWTQQLN